jgi:hypothetical protein
MKEDLVKLINSRNEIEKCFHSADIGLNKGFEIIHDTQEFQDWLQSLLFELQYIFDHTNNKFIFETITLCKSNMNGVTDKRIFMELSGKLKAISEKIDQLYPDNEVTNQNNYGSSGEKSECSTRKPLIFISHSSENKKQVGFFVEMLRAINLQPRTEIFCSSLPGYDIPIEYNGSIFEFLKSNFLNYDIHMIIFHSKEYYDSPVCLNEMGAAWALKSNCHSILLPGFDYINMKGVINDEKIAIKLDKEQAEVYDKLNQLRDEFVKEFNLIKVPDIIWEKARNDFVDKVNLLKNSEDV